MSFSDTIFLFFLALILFGPKKLPEMARQAGRLLAELRRASNDFRSQIETEIAHLEVEKKHTEIATSVSSPPGTVASLGLNPAVAESIPHQPVAPATLADPAATAAAPGANASSAAPESTAAPGTTTSQASHV